MSEVSLLKGSGFFVKPNLWNDRQREKARLSLPFALVNLGLKRNLFQNRDLKLLFDGKVLDENFSVDDILATFNSEPTSSVETSSHVLTNNNFALLNNREMTSENKHVDLLTLLEIRNPDILFLPDIWLNPLCGDNICSFFGPFYVQRRANRNRGNHCSVITLCRRNCVLNISEIFTQKGCDFVVAATPKSFLNSVAQFILFYQLPATSSYTIYFNKFSSFFEDVVWKGKSF